MHLALFKIFFWDSYEEDEGDKRMKEKTNKNENKK